MKWVIFKLISILTICPVKTCFLSPLWRHVSVQWGLDLKHCIALTLNDNRLLTELDYFIVIHDCCGNESLLRFILIYSCVHSNITLKCLERFNTTKLWLVVYEKYNLWGKTSINYEYVSNVIYLHYCCDIFILRHHWCSKWP